MTSRPAKTASEPCYTAAMAEKQPITDRSAASRIHVGHHCGYPLVCARATDDQERHWVAYFARVDEGNVQAGQRITVCPHCGQKLRSMPWREFLEEMSAAWGA